MKRSLVLVPILAASFALSARADDKKNVISVAITAKKKGAPTTTQVPQYGLCDTLHHWGFSVQSRVPTQWDKFLAKGGVTVVPPEPEKKDDKKKDDKKKDEKPLEAATFTIEGTIDYVPKDNKFYDSSLPMILFVAEVQIVVKDASGKELKKIAWKDFSGDNSQKGEAAVLAEAEARVVRFLTVDIFSIKEIADLIPQEKKEEFGKFFTHEKEQRDRLFDAWENHEAKEKEAEKKAQDEKK